MEACKKSETEITLFSPTCHQRPYSYTHHLIFGNSYLNPQPKTNTQYTNSNGRHAQETSGIWAISLLKEVLWTLGVARSTMKSVKRTIVSLQIDITDTMIIHCMLRNQIASYLQGSFSFSMKTNACKKLC